MLLIFLPARKDHARVLFSPVKAMFSPPPMT